MTLWGQTAEQMDESRLSDTPALLIKRATVNDYHGRTLSLSFGGTIHINPDIKECHDLWQWCVLGVVDVQVLLVPFGCIIVVVDVYVDTEMTGKCPTAI